MHRAGKLHSIGVRLDKNCLVSALEQVARPLPFDVDIRRVCTTAPDRTTADSTYVRNLPRSFWLLKTSCCSLPREVTW
jgi:hypothetical protein